MLMLMLKVSPIPKIGSRRTGSLEATYEQITDRRRLFGVISSLIRKVVNGGLQTEIKV